MCLKRLESLSGLLLDCVLARHTGEACMLEYEVGQHIGQSSFAGALAFMLFIKLLGMFSS